MTRQDTLQHDERGRVIQKIGQAAVAHDLHINVIEQNGTARLHCCDNIQLRIRLCKRMLLQALHICLYRLCDICIGHVDAQSAGILNKGRELIEVCARRLQTTKRGKCRPQKQMALLGVDELGAIPPKLPLRIKPMLDRIDLHAHNRLRSKMLFDRRNLRAAANQDIHAMMRQKQALRLLQASVAQSTLRCAGDRCDAQGQTLQILS